MLCELPRELCPGARVLVLELDASRAERIALGHLCHAVALDRARGGVGLLAELVALGRLRAVAAPGYHERQRAFAVRHAEMERREPAHRYAANVRLGRLRVCQHVADVVARARLRVLF